MSSISSYKGDFGAWETIKVVGKGGSSTVYKARISESGKLIAAKQIDTDGLTKEQIQNIKAEIDTIKDLSNTNIIAFLGSQQSTNKIFIFLEYADRGSMRQYYQKKGPLKELQASNCTRQILLGLDYLHNNGIAHRDIKCANCLLTKQGVVKLADFGASKKFESESIVSGLKGTPNWMAPEVIKGMQMTMGWMKADVWSLGCTVVEMLTAKLPFSEFDNPMTAMYHIANGRAPSLKLVLENLGGDENLESFRDITEMISLCCAADPESRPTVNKILGLAFVRKRLSGKGLDPEADNTQTDSSAQLVTKVNSLNLVVEGRSIHTPNNSSARNHASEFDMSVATNNDPNMNYNTVIGVGSNVSASSEAKIGGQITLDEGVGGSNQGRDEYDLEDLDAYEDDFEEEHEIIEERLNSNHSNNYVDVEIVEEGHSNNTSGSDSNDGTNVIQSSLIKRDRNNPMGQSTTLIAGTVKALAALYDNKDAQQESISYTMDNTSNINTTAVSATKSVSNNAEGGISVDTVNPDEAASNVEMIETPIMSHSTRKKIVNNSSNSSNSNNNSNNNSNSHSFEPNPNKTNVVRLSQIPRKVSAKTSNLNALTISTSSSSSTSSSTITAEVASVAISTSIAAPNLAQSFISSTTDSRYFGSGVQISNNGNVEGFIDVSSTGSLNLNNNIINAAENLNVANGGASNYHDITAPKIAPVLVSSVSSTNGPINSGNFVDDVNTSLISEQSSPVYHYNSPVKTFNKINYSDQASADLSGPKSSNLFDSSADLILPKNIGESFDGSRSNSVDRQSLVSSMKDPNSKLNVGFMKGPVIGGNSSGNNVKFIEAIMPVTSQVKPIKRLDSLLSSSSSSSNLSDQNAISNSNYSTNTRKKSASTNGSSNNSNNNNGGGSATYNRENKVKASKNFRSKSAGIAGHEKTKFGSSKAEKDRALIADSASVGKDAVRKLPPINTGSSVVSTKPISRHVYSAPAVSRSVSLPPVKVVSGTPHGSSTVGQMFPSSLSYGKDSENQVNSSGVPLKNGYSGESISSLPSNIPIPRPTNSQSPRLHNSSNQDYKSNNTSLNDFSANSNDTRNRYKDSTSELD